MVAKDLIERLEVRHMSTLRILLLFRLLALEAACFVVQWFGSASFVWSS